MKWDDSYEIKTTVDLNKIIKKNLPTHLKKVLDRKLEFLADNPNHPSLHCKPYNVSDSFKNKLGVDEVYEFYINMSFRCVIYIFHKKKQIVVAYVGDHNELKKRLK